MLGCASLLVMSLASVSWAQRTATESYLGHPVAAGEVLVKFREGASFAAQLHASSLADADVAHPVGRAGVQRMRSRSRDVASLISDLSGHPDVAYVEPNFILHAFSAPNDPMFGSLWGLHNTGQLVGGAPGLAGADVGAVQAWEVTTGSRASVVGVIDSGVDFTHPDLAANMWSAPTSFTVNIGGMNITCPAGSHGFDAIGNDCNPQGATDHGTHVAGTIGAAGNTGTGVVGVNWVASIMALRFIDGEGKGTTANAIKTIEFAIETKALFAGTAGANVRVLSASWGGAPFSQALLDAINQAHAHGMLFVAAAGNEGANLDATPVYPASYPAPNVIAVAATTNRDELAWFSNHGPQHVHLAAPGVAIQSTVRYGGYAMYQGTSMAAPHVSGAAALILSRCELDTAALKAAILESVDPLPALAGRTVTGGRLNVGRAVTGCAEPAPAPRARVKRDFDGDGKADVLWRHASGPLVIWLMNGTAGATARSLDGPAQGSIIAGSGDFDGDGKADILWRHPSGAIEIWLMEGGAIRSAASPGAVTADWTIAGVADVDGDGKADILWRHADGALYVLRMDGTAVLGAGAVGSVASDWRVSGVGDFNGDGKADVLWRDLSGTVLVWLLNGAGKIAEGRVGAAANDWTIAGVGDFDGDGKADILWRHASGTVSEWLMDGTLLVGSGSPGAVGSEWTIVDVEDFDGDGIADILWRHANGDTAISLLRGLSVTGVGPLGAVSSGWDVP
jgi:hypothetical protein